MKTLLFIFLISTKLLAQESIFPQFDFNLINPFLPGKKVSQIPQIYGTPKKFELKDAQQVSLYKIVGKDGYSFPLIIQHLDDQILDFYTRPPSYFSTIFFIVILFRNMDFKMSITSLMVPVITYGVRMTLVFTTGECTITCFPVFYSQVAAKISFLQPISRLEKFSKTILLFSNDFLCNGFSLKVFFERNTMITVIPASI